MRRRKDLFVPVATLLLLGCLASCKDDLSDSDHYKAPEWLKGNAYEVLQSDGNHSIFLKGIDLSDYKSIVAGKSIVTVMAPNDDAFSSFLASKGYSSIEELGESDPEYLNKLIGYHLMYYAYDWSKLVNFRPDDGDGATDEEKEVDAGYYYKHRTHSIDPIEEVLVKLTSNATSETLISLYHYERYLPVLSNKLFETKGIDAGYNYNYFFPDTEWNGITGGDGGFNVANAKVLDTDNVVTDNGYLYHIDHVIEPLNTIYDELKNNSKFSQYLSLYDAYSTYDLADDETRTALGYQVYVHSHGDLPPIAWEWPVLSWSALSTLEYAGYNVFAPSNEAITEFFDSYWTADGGYTSLDDLDPLILQYFIYQSFANDRFIVFPEEIKNGTVTTSYGTPINIDPDQVTDRVMCANGTLYGMDKMEAPAIFSSVVGPAFKDTTYLDYLYVLDGSDYMLSLASGETNFVTLMPKNIQFANTDPAIRLYTTTDGKQLQQYSSDAGAFVEIGTSAKNNIVNIHVAANVSSLSSSGTQVVETNESYNYWFVHDGRITTNALFNEQLEPTYTGTPFVEFEEITNDGSQWDNGSSYAYGGNAIFEAASGDGLSRRLAVCNDKNYPYYMFAQLLQKAGLTGSTSLSETIVSADARFFAFIPTNSAIEEHLSEIPGCSGLTVSDGTISGTLSTTSKTSLANYLRSYFINNTMNSFSSYPYVGSSCNGDFYTTGTYRMNIADTGTTLNVRFIGSGQSANVISDYYCLPFAFSDGCFHLIDNILQ